MMSLAEERPMLVEPSRMSNLVSGARTSESSTTSSDSVEQGAVGRAEILHDVPVVGAREPRVLPGDVRVGDDDVVLLRAADGPRSSPLEQEAPVLRHYLHHLPREPVPLGLLGRDG